MRLARRLRVAVVAVPLALWGCEKTARKQVAGPIVDAAIVATLEADAALPPLDAAIAEVLPDAGALKVPGAQVKLPHLSGCAGDIRWCAPPAQSVSLATRSSKLADNGCPSTIQIRQDGVSFPMAHTRSGTADKRAKGKEVCCYDFQARCAKGRPLRERRQARLAAVVRGTRWNG